MSKLAKKAIDSAQLFNILVAKELAQKQVEHGRSTKLGPIRGKLQISELIKFSEVAQYVEIQKTDVYYD